MADVTSRRVAKSKKYCCICRDIYRGQTINGRTISLHRFPQDANKKRVWIQRCKTVKRTFEWNKHKRLCSEHFIGYKGPTQEYSLPSQFPAAGGATIEYPTWNLKGHEEQMSGNDDVPIDQGDAGCSDDVPMDQGDAETNSPNLLLAADCHQDAETNSPNLLLASDCHPLDVSLHLHDYCQEATTFQLSTRCMDTQTDINHQVSQEVQTNESFHNSTSHASTQTEKDTRDFGVQCRLPLLTYEDIKHNDELVSFYTGIPSKTLFEAVFDEIKDEAEARTSSRKAGYTASSGGRPRILDVMTEFLMVMMRLRLGLLIEDLSYRFCISTSQCSDIIQRWINYLSVQLSFLVEWPSKETIKMNMPKGFQDKFPNTRIIIDCTELVSESSSSLSLKTLMHSESHKTYKALVGISSKGIVTFVSDDWVGCTSDKKLTKECGPLDMVNEGDAVMVDKGSTISDLTTARGIDRKGKKKDEKFSKRQVLLTKDIAKLRIHVERQMEKIKKFRILQGSIPISQGKRISKVLKICTYLTNLWPPLVHDND